MTKYNTDDIKEFKKSIERSIEMNDEKTFQRLAEREKSQFIIKNPTNVVFHDVMKKCVENDFVEGIKILKKITENETGGHHGYFKKMWDEEASLLLYPKSPIGYSAYFGKIKCLEFLISSSNKTQIYQSFLMSLSDVNDNGEYSDDKKNCIKYIVNKYIEKLERQDDLSPENIKRMMGHIFKIKEEKFIGELISDIGENITGETVFLYFPNDTKINGLIDTDLLYEKKHEVMLAQEFNYLEKYWKLVKNKKNIPHEIIDLVEKISSDSRYLEFAPNIYLGENKRKIKKAIEEEGNFVNKKRKVKKI